jgi:hypothetical protein
MWTSEPKPLWNQQDARANHNIAILPTSAVAFPACSARPAGSQRVLDTVDDIVKVTQYLTRAEDVKAYAQVRNRFLGAARPASMLLVVPQLVWPSLLAEVEVVAAKA